MNPVNSMVSDVYASLDASAFAAAAAEKARPAGDERPLSTAFYPLPAA